MYGSLSFSERMSRLFVRLSLDTVETLGKAVGAEFLLRGVTGMPDPGPRWRPESRNPALTLPAGYMRGFAAKLYGLMMKKFRDPSLVDDAIMTYLARVTTSGEIKPMPLSAAESYVQAGVVKEALNLIRAQRTRMRDVRLEESLAPGVDGERGLADTLEDPRALRDMQHELSPRVWRQWMDYLAKHLHPDIPLYIGYSMEGWTDGEIVGKPGQPGKLPHVQIETLAQAASFWKHKIDRIPEISKRFFDLRRDEMPTAV